MSDDQSSLSGIKMFPQDIEAFRNQKTLRDEFAMAALTGLLSIPATYTEGAKEPDADAWIANGAYAIADAMLEARKK